MEEYEACETREAKRIKLREKALEDRLWRDAMSDDSDDGEDTSKGSKVDAGMVVEVPKTAGDVLHNARNLFKTEFSGAKLSAKQVSQQVFKTEPIRPRT